MSHSTVLVIGPDPEKQLEPFNEQPEDGSPYLVFNDEEDEYLKGYNEKTVKKIVLEDGTLVLPWDDRFKKPGALGFGSDTHEAPAHLERRKVPFKETYATFEEYMEDWCGYTRGRDPEKKRYGSWRNPRAKWDGYSLGGRWTGFFQLKRNEVEQTEYNKLVDNEILKLALDHPGFSLGEALNLRNIRKRDPQVYQKTIAKFNGKGAAIDTLIKTLDVQIGIVSARNFAEGDLAPAHINHFSAKNNQENADRWKENFEGGKADQAPKSSIDFQRMEDEAREKATKEFDNWEKFLAGRPVHKSWQEIYGKATSTDPENKLPATRDAIDVARALYQGQELVQEAKTPAGEAFLGEYYPFGDGIDAFLVGREAYITIAVAEAYSTFAILKDDVWYERGDMGWWGMVSDEKDRLTWAQEFLKLLHSLPDDTLLSVYDVHI